MTLQPPYPGDAPVAWQNFVIAAATQAMLGLITDGISSIAIRFLNDGLELHVAAPAATSLDREAVDDIIDDLHVVLEGRTPIESIIHEGKTRFENPDTDFCTIYLKRPDTAPESGQDPT